MLGDEAKGLSLAVVSRLKAGLLALSDGYPPSLRSWPVHHPPTAGRRIPSFFMRA